METYKGKQIEEFLSKVRDLELEYGLRLECDNEYSVDFLMLSYKLGESNIRVHVERTETDDMFVDDSIDEYYCPKCGSTTTYFIEALEDGTEIHDCGSCGEKVTFNEMINYRNY